MATPWISCVSASCVAFVNSAGEAVTPDPERATGQEQQTVTLAPSASAWSALVFTNPAISGVTTVTPAALLVTPPDETASIKVRWTGRSTTRVRRRFPK
jgi:hypothetical protein